MRKSLAFVCFGFAVSAFGQFSPPAAFPVGFAPRRVAVADVLGGPDKDVLTVQAATSGDDTLHVLVNQGAGQPPTGSTFSVMATVSTILTGDVDGDGDTDVVATSANGITVLKRNGQTLSRNDQMIGFGYFAVSRLLDWDTDGDLDLFNGFDWASNDGAGNFDPGAGTVPGALFNATYTVGDFDGDGDPDVAYLFAGGGFVTATVFHHVGDSLLVSSQVNVPGFSGALASIDFNDDGLDDLVVYGSFGNLGAAAAQAGGNFGPVVVTNICSQVACPTSNVPVLFAAELMGDGTKDVVLALKASNDIIAAYPFDISPAGLPSAGNGGTSLTANAADLAFGDVDRDGDDDVAFGSGFAAAQPAVNVSTNGTVLSRDYDAIVVSGDDQPCPIGGTILAPIVVRFTLVAGGLPVPNLNVRIMPSGGCTIPIGLIVTTNAQGEIAIPVDAGGFIGRFRIRCHVAGSDGAVATVRVAPPVALSILSGEGQATSVGRTLLHPLVVQALDPWGAPVAGAVLNVAAYGSAALPNGPTVTTAPDGSAAIAATGGTYAGLGLVEVSLGSGAAGEIFSFFVRELTVNRFVGPNIVTVTYEHEDGPLPLLLAADLPRPVITTSYGDIATSVLAPLPGFVAVDGLGYFGPPDAGAVANPVFARVFTNIAPVLFGLTFVFQAYSIDFDYPFPDYVVLSNVVTLTL